MTNVDRQQALAEAYLQAALDAEARAVAGAGQGGRNDQLNLSAFALGRLVGGGALDRGRAEQVLTSAAKDACLDARRIAPTLRRGLDAGAQQPREIPAPRAGSNGSRAARRAQGGVRGRQDARQAARGHQDTRGSNTAQKPADTPPCAPVGAVKALMNYQAALAGGPGEAYLTQRGVPIAVARRHGLGYAAPKTWLGRDWIGGRVVVPHTDPDGNLINLYGRAIGGDDVPKHLRHDHLPGGKANFNAPALRPGDGPVYVCEGAFDALALIAAGIPRTIAIFGKSGWRWDWARGIDELVIAFDADAGSEARDLARQALLRGKRASILPPEAYAGHKDASTAWAAGVLTLLPLAPPELRDDVEERAAILQYDAGLPRLEAEHQAVAEFSRRRESAESCRNKAECFQDAENTPHAADSSMSYTSVGDSDG